MEKFNVEDYWLDDYWKSFMSTLHEDPKISWRASDSFADKIEQKKDVLLINLALPGVRKENVEITVENDYLWVEVLKDSTFIAKIKKDYYIKEYNPDSVLPKLENGVLRIRLEKKEKLKPKKVEF